MAAQLPAIQPFRMKDPFANLQAMQTMKAQGQAAQMDAMNEATKIDLNRQKFGLEKQKFGLEKQKFAEEQQSEVRKTVIEMQDFTLNVLAGVNSEEDLQVAKSMIKARYPGKGDVIDRHLPNYSPTGVSLIQNMLRTEGEKLRAAELEWEQSKPQAFSAGSVVTQKGEDPFQVPFKPDKPDFELFEDGEGNQAYLKKGAAVPRGFTRMEKKGGGVTINMPKAAPSGEREKLNKLFEFKSQLDRIKEQYNPKYVGRVEGVVGAGKELTGVGADKDESKFRQVVKDIADTLLRLRSGAQINEQEYKRLSKLVPTLNLPDTVFLARLESLTKAIDHSITTRKGTLSESGFIAPSGGSGGGVVIRFDAQGNEVE